MATIGNELSERLPKVVQRLRDIPPLTCEGPTKKFNIKGGGIAVTLNAISSYEAGLRTAFVFNEFQIDESHIQCESLNDGVSSDVFEYTVNKAREGGSLCPRVVLRRKVMTDVSQNRDESNDDINTATGSRGSTATSSSTNSSFQTETGPDDFLDEVLINVFGHEHFKPQQKETILKTMRVKTVLSIMGTGGGKSLTFMLPAFISSKPTVVISPTRSLLEDLLDRSLHLGISSCMFIGGITGGIDVGRYRTDLQKYKLIYITPEMLDGPLMEAITKLDTEGNLERIVFDEAHTIATWGSTFRPKYKEVVEVLATFHAPKLLLSATVPVRIQEQLKHVFRDDSWEVVAHSVYRDNLLTLTVQEKGKHFYDELSKFILQHKEESSIIYCVLPKDVSKIQGELKKRNISCVTYHGQLSVELKSSNFEKWMSGEAKVMVANASFGMGIDKPDVRFIIHAKLPTSLEEYFQQCGRAGRDGNPAMCLLYYSYSDKYILYKLFKCQGLNFDQQCDILNDLIVFLENPIQCRHMLVMTYFGEDRDEFSCINNCDNCVSQGMFYTSDGTEDALKVVHTLVELGNTKITCNTLKLILNGSRQKMIQENGFDEKSNFGCLSKKFAPPVFLDKFLHLLIHTHILGEEVGTSNKSFNVRIILGANAHSLLALNLSCYKYVKY